jgi:hypothetical protein
MSNLNVLVIFATTAGAAEQEIGMGFLPVTADQRRTCKP